MSWASLCNIGAGRCLLPALDVAWPAASTLKCLAARALHTGSAWQHADAPSDAGTQREAMDFDVAIVGAGPAGLSAAIRLKQRCQEAEKDLTVCVVEKGAEVGESCCYGATAQCIWKKAQHNYSLDCPNDLATTVCLQDRTSCQATCSRHAH